MKTVFLWKELTKNTENCTHTQTLMCTNMHNRVDTLQTTLVLHLYMILLLNFSYILLIILGTGDAKQIKPHSCHYGLHCLEQRGKEKEKIDTWIRYKM